MKLLRRLLTVAPENIQSFRPRQGQDGKARKARRVVAELEMGFATVRDCVSIDIMTVETISTDSPMCAVLEVFPDAQRALFRRYHIGGCSSCGFQPTETLAQVCERNGNLDVDEVLAHIQSSHELDARILIEPKELAGL